MASKLEMLRSAVLFENFTDTELEHLAQVLGERWVSAGQTVFSEGESGSSLFLIQSGKVDIFKRNPEAQEILVSTLGEGAHFGEMAFVDRAPRAAGARASTGLKLLEIHFDDLEKVVSTQPLIGLKLYHSIAKTLCSRIRKTNDALSAFFLDLP
jgi:CRP/FNR family cyclic AMP-dependent transcriptional regulator